MCGIAGILALQSHPADQSSAIQLMVTCLAHRGPDKEGIYNNVTEGVYLGHRRLSIIDLSDLASQPMIDYEGRYILIFNGEIYNYPELRMELTEYPFRTHSDSETILAAYRKWGQHCVSKFNGIFAFAIYDQMNNSLFVARDQLGIKPVYYFDNGSFFVFASEIRSLLASGLIDYQLDNSALDDYLTYQSTLRNQTLVKGIQRLEAGTTLFISKQDIQKNLYWDILQRKSYNFQNEQCVRTEVRNRVLTAVKRQMVSDVPIGAFLSGGIDSSIMVAAMAMNSEQPINTFTVTFEESAYDESDYALIIAKKYGTNHTEIPVYPEELVHEIPIILSRMDSPSGDGINSYIISEAIKKAGLKVAISGLGGDELFAGYAYSQWYQRIISQNGVWSHTGFIRNAAAAILRMNNSAKSNKLSALLEISEPALYNVYPILRSVFSPKEISKLLPKEHHTTCLVEDLKRKNQEINQFPLLSQFGIGDILGYTEGVLLKDSDQMSMAHSIELRVPFFDVELVEYVLAIPDQFKKPITPKKLLVDAMGTMIPEAIWNKKKMGFVLPWDLWLRRELNSYCESAIWNLNSRHIFKKDVLISLWQEFLSGSKSVSWAKIWTLVVLEKWIGNVIDKKIIT